MMLGSVNATSMSSIRPPMLAGPIERKAKDDSSGFDEVLKGGCCGAPPPRWAEATEAAMSGSAASQRRRMDEGVFIRRIVLCGWGVCVGCTRQRIRLLGS